MNGGERRVLILGAGINGAAIARELTAGGVSVCVVDTADVASGTTAYSSRLIHGGLRYLEYRELDLVRESLAERTRLLRLAPQFVRPLRLFIPSSNRWGGMWRVLRNMLGLGNASAATRPAAPRGAMLVRIGLWLYDRYARDPSLPKHTSHRVGEQRTVAVDPQCYRWLNAYYDAQVMYPERLTLAMLEDARRSAHERGAAFDVLTYHRAELHGEQVQVFDERGGSDPVLTFQPAAIINATGAWVDETLRRLHVESEPLIGGIKGSHLLTHSAELRAALNGDALYVEAPDGRPVFMLPLGDATLIGTTDIAYHGDPAQAVASDEEIGYLIETAGRVLPQAKLTKDDISLHYCGVRPLPHTGGAKRPGAITRRHGLTRHENCRVPLFSVIGGKITTCRSLAEETAATVLEAIGQPVVGNTREQVFAGGENYPASEADVRRACEQLAAETGFDVAQVERVWELLGTRTKDVLGELSAGGRRSIADTSLPGSLARWMIEHEWARTLADLVERRLMLLYDQQLSVAGLRQLAEVLVEAGALRSADVEVELAAYRRRLKEHFGRDLAG
jgi:glycerol-3-phosphate dehydrogenase